MITPSWSTEQEQETQRVRVETLRAVAIAARSIPRRLGGDATPSELREDKRTARRIIHLCETNYRMLGGSVEAMRAPEAGDRVAGAVVDWPDRIQQEMADIKAAQARAEELGYRDGKKQWMTSIVYHLETEWLQLRRIRGLALGDVAREGEGSTTLLLEP